jgi:site-specific DNA-methyltransferase (adenine-specific)
VRELDEQAGYARSGGYPERRQYDQTRLVYGKYSGEISDPKFQNTAGYVSRFFYCSKASKSERDLGLEDFHWRRTDSGWERISDPAAYPDDRIITGNVHPTVKPLDLIRYLARMVLPPELDGPRRILVPFAGSGSEMIGARQAEWDEVVGVELSEAFAAIAEARLLANIGMF